MVIHINNSWVQVEIVALEVMVAIRQRSGSHWKHWNEWMIRVHSLETMNINTSNVPFMFCVGLTNVQTWHIPVSARFACLHMDKGLGGRRSLLQIALRLFLMSDWDKSSDFVPDADARPADRSWMLVQLNWSWQLVNRLQGDFRSLSGLYWP